MKYNTDIKKEVQLIENLNEKRSDNATIYVENGSKLKQSIKQIEYNKIKQAKIK